MLFDDDDLRLAHQYGKLHFYEWFAAIHLFHRHGALSLLEKYAFGNHPRKVAVYRTLFREERQRHGLKDISRKWHVQPPDLLVYIPGRRIWFVEVKGVRDRLTLNQRRSHQDIRRRLCFEVETVRVVQLNIAGYRLRAAQVRG